MRNRIYGIFMLLSVILLGYGAYYYFFVANKATLIFEGNVGEYQVSLYNKNLKVHFQSFCKEQKCILEGIAPLEYTIEISKQGYKSKEFDVVISKKSQETLGFELDKKLLIERIEGERNNTSSNDKITKAKEILDLPENYKMFDLEELGYFYFIKTPTEALDLFMRKEGIDTKITSFSLVAKKDLDIFNLDQVSDEVAIIFGEKLYIYEISKGYMHNITFANEVEYIKKWGSKYQIITPNGSFFYDTQTDEIEYFYIFKDFVFVGKNEYIGIIGEDEIQKKKNYNLKDFPGNLIIKYDFTTQDIKILERINQKISKILLEDERVYFLGSDGEKYLVDNYN